MIEFRLKALTARGETIIKSLQQGQHELHCYCPPNESCLVEITEMPDQRIDVIVTKPRAVAEPGEWKPYTVVHGMYGRRFDKGTNAERLHASIDQILGAPSQANPVRSGTVPVSRVSPGKASAGLRPA